MNQKLYIHTFLFALFISRAIAQTPLPYYTGFDNASEKAGWTEHRKGDNGVYQWQYFNIAPVSAPAVLLHTYPVGGNRRLVCFTTLQFQQWRQTGFHFLLVRRFRYSCIIRYCSHLFSTGKFRSCFSHFNYHAPRFQGWELPE